MNPAFRWVTVVGACLVITMGLLLAGSPGRGSVSAVVIFALFFVLVAVAQPQAGGVAPLFAPPEGAPTIDRDGYALLPLQTLFQSLDREAQELEGRQAAIRGVVKRIPALDTQGMFVLLEPMMTCCLADAVAFGVRVKIADGALPEDGSWQYVFGDLRGLEAPVATPSFRLGAIVFTPVSRAHEFSAHEVVPLQSLLDDLFDTMPEEFAATFRRLAAESGVEGTLRGEAPFTLFALHEAAFESMPAARREALARDADGLRRLLEGLIVLGRHVKSDLYDISSLTTLAGTTLPVQLENGRLRIGGARVLLGPPVAAHRPLTVLPEAESSRLSHRSVYTIVGSAIVRHMHQILVFIVEQIALAQEHWRATVGRLRPLSGRISELEERVARLEVEAALLRSRLCRFRPRNRPHFRPAERFGILLHAARYRISVTETARTFGVTRQTIINWRNACRNSDGSIGRLPVRTLPELIDALVHQLKTEWPRWGTRHIAGHPCPPRRARGLEVAVQRILRTVLAASRPPKTAVLPDHRSRDSSPSSPNHV